MEDEVLQVREALQETGQQSIRHQHAPGGLLVPCGEQNLPQRVIQPCMFFLLGGTSLGQEAGLRHISKEVYA